MATFDTFLPQLLRFEGGFVDDPADPGGATNKGITLKTFTACSKRLLGIDPTLSNLKLITDEQAGKIYKELYWDKINGDGFGVQELANIICDFYVNAGTNAIKLLQRVLNAVGTSPPLAEDGSIGPATLQEVQRADQKEVYRRYKQGRREYYETLANDHPALRRFLNGWLNRVNTFPDL
jgi:lysozyme family protein